jgi:glutamate-1-semialdehyde 2,1-aminomutase
LKRQNPYNKLNKIAERVESILLHAAKKYGVEITVNRFGSMMNPFFAKEEVTNFKDAQKCDTDKFAIFFWEMIKNGVFLPPSQFESWFLCSAMSDTDIKNFENAADTSMKAVSEK